MRLIDGDAALEILRRERAKAKRIGEKQNDFMQGAMSALRAVCVMLEHQPTVNEWTMCFEKLPSAFEKVRACDAEGNIEEGFVEKVGKHVICKTGDHFCLDYVVAWMPLPLPYEGDEDK